MYKLSLSLKKQAFCLLFLIELLYFSFCKPADEVLTRFLTILFIIL